MITASKTECTKCGASFLKSTAARNAGICQACDNLMSPENVTQGLELGFRLLLGVFFASVFGSAGFGIGSIIGTFAAIVVAVLFAIAGLVYGFFAAELNALFRAMIF